MYIYLAFNLASVRSKTGRQISPYPSSFNISIDASNPSFVSFARQRTIIADKACHEMLSSSCSFVLLLFFEGRRRAPMLEARRPRRRGIVCEDARISRVSNSKYHVKRSVYHLFFLLLLLLLLLWILTKLAYSVKAFATFCLCAVCLFLAFAHNTSLRRRRANAVVDRAARILFQEVLRRVAKYSPETSIFRFDDSLDEVAIGR